MTSRRTFVLDTSVLLSDPGALLRFGGSDVVLPLVVIGELEEDRLAGRRAVTATPWRTRHRVRVLGGPGN